MILQIHLPLQRNSEIKVFKQKLFLLLQTKIKLLLITLYGSIAILDGKSETDLLGVNRGQSNFIVRGCLDLFSVSLEVGTTRDTLCDIFQLDLFRLHVLHNLSRFGMCSVGINFGFNYNSCNNMNQSSLIKTTFLFFNTMIYIIENTY